MEPRSAIQAAFRDRDSSARPYAVLDFDNTCIVNDIGEAVLAYMCENGLIRDSARVFRRYHDLLTNGDFSSAYLFAAKTLAGFTEREVKTIVSSTIEAEGADCGSRDLFGISISRGLKVVPAVGELIEFLKENDVAIWIVSASPEIAVRVAARHFSIAGQVIGLKNKIDGKILSAEIQEPYSISEGKVACIKTFIDSSARPELAISDSMNDLPMLEYAEIPVVVDRDNELTLEAKRRGWFILSQSD